MASIHKIKQGQILFDVKRNSGIVAFQSKFSVWPVLVEEVNIEEGYIVARWNMLNPPRKMYQKTIKGLRVNEPK